MNILQYQASQQAWFTKYEKEEYGYETITTFFGDFSIAECFDINAVKDTFKKSVKSWKHDIKYITELALVVNIKCWQHHQQNNSKMMEAYRELYYQVRDLVYADNSPYSEEDREYYFRVTD